MNPKIPSKELEQKKNKKWLKDESKGSSLADERWRGVTDRDQDPWLEATQLLGKIEPWAQIPEKYDFQKLHDQVMQKVDQFAPPWLKKRS